LNTSDPIVRSFVWADKLVPPNDNPSSI